MMEVGRAAWIYVEVTKRAFADEIITDDEASILRVLSESFGISPEMNQQYLSFAKGEEESDLEFPDTAFQTQTGDFSLYQSALIAALEDDVITSDEWEMINLLSDVMNIQDSEHALIEEAIRDLNRSSKAGVPLIDRYVSMVKRTN